MSWTRSASATESSRSRWCHEADGSHHARERQRDPPGILPAGRAEDRRELRHAGEEGLLQRPDVPPRRARFRRAGGLPEGHRHRGPGLHHSRRVQHEQARARLARHGPQPAPGLRGLAVLHHLRPAAAPRQQLHGLRQGHERHGARRSHPPGRQDEVRHHHRGIAVPWSLLLRGGIVIDGTGTPGRRADVAVEGERIAAVAPGLAGAADRVLDVTGRVVAPGFIDMHSHSDLFYFGCPSAESKIRQGVTTEVVGMCSFSQAPVRPEQQALMKGWVGGIGMTPDLPWVTFCENLAALRSVRPSVNVVHLVGHGALRIAAMGFEARPAGADGLRGMERLLGEAMDAGAWGFSTGLVYPPSAYANTQELIALARSMRSRHGFYFSHVRGESSMLLDSIAEAIRIGDESGVPAQIAHVKASGRENWSKLEGALGLIDDARRRG